MADCRVEVRRIHYHCIFYQLRDRGTTRSYTGSRGLQGKHYSAEIFRIVHEICLDSNGKKCSCAHYPKGMQIDYGSIL